MVKTFLTCSATFGSVLFNDFEHYVCSVTYFACSLRCSANFDFNLKRVKDFKRKNWMVITIFNLSLRKRFICVKFHISFRTLDMDSYFWDGLYGLIILMHWGIVYLYDCKRKKTLQPSVISFYECFRLISKDFETRKENVHSNYISVGPVGIYILIRKAETL